MSELEAQVGSPEAVDGNGQLDHLVPAGAVVVVEHERAILAGVGLAAAQADAVLRGRRIHLWFIILEGRSLHLRWQK